MKGGAEVVGLLKIGSAFQAPAVAIEEMVEAVLLDRQRLIPCSVYLQGQYGIQDVFCGTIAKLGSGGIQHVCEVPPSDDELARVQQAAAVQDVELILAQIHELAELETHCGDPFGMTRRPRRFGIYRPGQGGQRAPVERIQFFHQVGVRQRYRDLIAELPGLSQVVVVEG